MLFFNVIVVLGHAYFYFSMEVRTYVHCKYTYIPIQIRSHLICMCICKYHRFIMCHDANSAYGNMHFLRKQHKIKSKNRQIIYKNEPLYKRKPHLEKINFDFKADCRHLSPVKVLSQVLSKCYVRTFK